MLRNRSHVDSPRRRQNGADLPISPCERGEDRQIPKNLERFAPWLKVVRLLVGPLFWVALVVIGGFSVAVAVLSWTRWEPGLPGRVVTAWEWSSFG